MKKSTLLLALYFVITLPVFFLEPFGDSNSYYTQGLSLLSTAFVVVTGWLLLKTYGRGLRFPSLLLFALSFSALLIANLIFNYSDFVLHTYTYPSPADIFYLAYTLCIFLALMFEFRAADITWKNISKKVYIISGLFALGMIALFCWLTLFSAYSPDATLAENVVTIGYPVGDLLLVLGSFVLVLMIADYQGGKAAKVWLFIFLGLLATLAGDMLYAIFTDQYSTHAGPLYAITQLSYISAYLFVTFAFVNLRSTLLAFRAKSVTKKS